MEILGIIVVICLLLLGPVNKAADRSEELKRHKGKRYHDDGTECNA